MSFKTDLKDELRYFGGMSGGEYKNEDLDEAVDSITELVKGLVGEDETEELNDFDWRKTRNELRRELKEKLK